MGPLVAGFSVAGDIAADGLALVLCFLGGPFHAVAHRPASFRREIGGEDEMGEGPKYLATKLRYKNIKKSQ